MGDALTILILNSITLNAKITHFIGGDDLPLNFYSFNTSEIIVDTSKLEDVYFQEKSTAICAKLEAEIETFTKLLETKGIIPPSGLLIGSPAK